MTDNILDDLISTETLHAFVEAQYDLCCDWIRENPTSTRPPMLIVATAPSTPDVDGNLHMHVFDDGLGNVSETLYHIGRSFGQRYLIVSAAILTLQAMGVRMVEGEEDMDIEDARLASLQKILRGDDLLEGIVVCALASDKRCILKAATIQREGDTVDFDVTAEPEGTASGGKDNTLTAFYEGYEAGLVEVQTGQRTN
jgi:hypothetical protein